MNRSRLILVGAAAGAAAAVALVLVLTAGNGNSGVTTTSSSTSSSPPATPATPFGAGIPQQGDTLGKPGAPATLTVYEDPQCPFCRTWNVDTLPTVVADYVRTGKLKLVYRGVIIIGPDSERGLRAIYAAGRQNKLWNFADALYTHQGAENSGWITNRVILAAAREAGAGGKAILAAMSSAAVTADLTNAAKRGIADHVGGTPTFILARPPALSQQLTVTALDPATFVGALTAALQG